MHTLYFFLLHPYLSLSLSLSLSISLSLYLSLTLSLIPPLSLSLYYLPFSHPALQRIATQHTLVFSSLYPSPLTITLHVWLAVLPRENSEDRLPILLRSRTELPDVRSHRVQASLPRRRSSQHDWCAKSEGHGDVQGQQRVSIWLRCHRLVASYDGARSEELLKRCGLTTRETRGIK